MFKLLVVAALLLKPVPAEPEYNDDFYRKKYEVAHTLEEDLLAIVAVTHLQSTDYYFFRKLATGRIACVDVHYEREYNTKFSGPAQILEGEKIKLLFYDSGPGILRLVGCDELFFIYSTEWIHIPVDIFGSGLKDPPEELLHTDEEIFNLLEKDKVPLIVPVQ